MALSFQDKIRPVTDIPTDTSGLSFASKITPVTSSPDPDIQQSLADKIWSGLSQPTFKATGQESILGGAGKLLGNIPSSAIGFGKNLIDFFNPINTIKTAQELGTEIEGAQQEGIKPTDVAKEIPRAAYETVVPQFLQHIISGDFEKARAKIEEDPVGQIAPLLLLAKGAASKLGKGAEFDAGIKKITSPIIEPTKAVVSGAGKAISNIKELIEKNAVNDTQAVGKILQGKTQDIQSGLRTLREIPTEGINTYKDLSSVLQDRVKTLSKVVDEKLDGDQIPKLKGELVIETQVGEKAVQFNYVDKALKDLKELYKKTTDPQELERVNQLITQAENTGLTAKEVNNIAREYNIEFGEKAFNPRTGDPITSVNAQSYENVRKGVKETARKMMPDEKTQLIDAQIADTLNTQRLVKKMSEKVSALEQRVNKRGIIEKIGRGIASGVDLATFGGLRGFIARLFPSNIGLKTLNSLDLQNQLTKNLKIIQKIIDAPTEEAVANGIINYTKSRLVTDPKLLKEAEESMMAGIEDFTLSPIDDLVNGIVKGKISVRIPESIRKDALETLGQGNYARIFRKHATSPNLSSLDELADNVGISDIELLNLIEKKLRKSNQ